MDSLNKAMINQNTLDHIDSKVTFKNHENSADSAILQEKNSNDENNDNKKITNDKETKHEKGLREFVAELDAHGQELYGTSRTLYNAISHPVFKDWTVLREERFCFLRPFIPIVHDAAEQKWPATAVDVGAHLGYFASRLADCGLQTVAVEYEEKFARWCRELSLFASSSSFDVIHTDCISFFETCVEEKRKFDIATAMSLVYHLFKRDRERARLFLRLLVRSAYRIFIDDEPTYLPSHVLLKEIVDACNECGFRFRFRLLFASLKDRRKIFLVDVLPTNDCQIPHWLSIEPDFCVFSGEPDRYAQIQDLMDVSVESMFLDLGPKQTDRYVNFVEFVKNPKNEHYYAVFYRTVLANFDEKNDNFQKWLSHNSNGNTEPSRRDYFYDLWCVMNMENVERSLTKVVPPLQCYFDSKSNSTRLYLYEGCHRLCMYIALQQKPQKQAQKITIVLTEKRLYENA